MRKNILIMGAAGRDFHNYNTLYRTDETVRVKAFTATQIPDIDGRVYPAELAGPLYPEGIPVLPEKDLAGIISEHGVHEAVFSYSDISHTQVMHRASSVLAAGADFRLVSPAGTMLSSSRPVVSVCAVRTGSGKSPTTARICDILRHMGKRPVVVRHPMPYGDLAAQAVQRFARVEDFEKHQCTIEEREEYEHLVERGIVVYAGVDYGRILRQAEEEADVLIWDGGNNDTPFFRPDLSVVVVDPLRPGHELAYHPGETNLLMADVCVVGKVDSAEAEDLQTVLDNIARANPTARIIQAETRVIADDPEALAEKRVLAVEDGPTLTHGDMAYGAAAVAAKRHGATLVDPRPHLHGELARHMRDYPHIGPVLPALGYSPRQTSDLEQTINAIDCDMVLFGTPIRLDQLLQINTPSMRVRYRYAHHSGPHLSDLLRPMLEEA